MEEDPKEEEAPSFAKASAGKQGKLEQEGSISMLRRNLYAKDEPIELKKRTQELLTPKKPKTFPEAVAREMPALTNVMQEKAKRRRSVMRWSASIALAVLIFAGGIWLTMWYRSTQQVAQSHIQLEIAAPTRFTAGEVIEYGVQIKNTSRVEWTTVDLTFTPPAGFTYESSSPAGQASEKNVTVSLPPLSPDQSNSFTVRGRLIGEEGATALAQAEAIISPKNFPKEKIMQSQTASTIVSAIPLDISIEAAKSAAVGERIAAIIHVRNLSDAPIEGAVLRLSPAAGMQLAIEDTGFSPEFSVLDSFWRLPKIDPLGEVIRYSVLYVSGNAGDQRQLDVDIIQQQNGQTFTLRSISHVVLVTSSQLEVTQAFNSDATGKLTVASGQRLDGIVQYKNTGTTGLTDAIVKVKFEGTGLDPATLKLNSGAYDPTTSTLTWTAASVPALKNVLPGAGGQIAYSFSMLPYDKFPLQPNGKNQQLIVTASLDSPDLPKPTGQARQVISDRFFLPVATDMLLGADAFYDDGRLGITSSGPVPPKVGQQTTYTLRASIGSSLNDIENMKVIIVLPDGVSYTGQSYKTAGEIDYNNRTNTMTWTMPILEGLVGRSVPAQELRIQVAITPGENVRGQVVKLVQSIEASGTDSFTDTATGARISEMPTTRTASPQNGEVQ